MQAQNDEMMALVMEQYNSMSVSMEEEKKAKLEQLYDQIVSFQESIDSAKSTLETTAREAETDARVRFTDQFGLMVRVSAKFLINLCFIFFPTSHLKTFMKGKELLVERHPDNLIGQCRMLMCVQNKKGIICAE